MTLQSAITNLVNKVVYRVAILIGAHNTSITSHNDIRSLIDTKSNVNHTHANLASISYVDTQISNAGLNMNDYVLKTEYNAHSHKTLEITNTISANSDLNSYKTNGIYTCSNTNSSTVANRPFDGTSNFILEIKKYDQDTIMQVLYMITADSSRAIYFRIFISNNWTTWKKVFDEYSIDTTLSDSSTKPIQNKAVKAALDLKANTSSIPTKVSDLTNDSQFVSTSDLNGKQDKITIQTQVLNSQITLYKWGSVATIHITDWNCQQAISNIRNSYVQINEKIPNGFKPFKTIYIRDVMKEQHIIIGNDGNIHVLIGGSVDSGANFNGQASWIIGG